MAGLLLALALPTRGGAAPAPDALRAGFRNPPREARPSAYWPWFNGHVDRGHAEAELNALRDAGFRGVCLFDMGARDVLDARPPAGPSVLGDG